MPRSRSAAWRSATSTTRPQREATTASLPLDGTLGGITIWTGYGDETIFIDGTHLRAGLRTVTTLNTGLGDDHVTVDLDAGEDGFFVLNTQGPFNDYLTLGDRDTVRAAASTLPLIIFGGQDQDDLVAGQADDLVFGDRGRVLYFDNPALADLGLPLATLESLAVSVLGRGGAGDKSDGVIRPALLALSVDRLIGDSDILQGEGDDDILIGGAAGDIIDGDGERDLIFGDNVRLDRVTGLGDLTSPRFRALSGTQIYDADDNVLIDGTDRSDPTGTPAWADWDILLHDHSFADEAAALNNFGDDYIAGGNNDDTIFGQLGDDVIQGDGAVEGALGGTPVAALRNPDGTLTVQPSFEAASDGDDYIEGNGGDDLIFGGLGQDDILGGNSSLFSLNDPTRRPDGSDMIFGGAGTDLLRNNLGDENDEGHARDSDMILGDNGNLQRLVGTNGADSGSLLTFTYDDYSALLRIVPRSAELLDYTPGGVDFDPAGQATDIGAADEIHGESGDDFIYGMKDSDVLFGEGQDDDLYGGYGHDWISGGAGQDGVIGDDGRIYTSRNGSGGETLYGIAALGSLDLEITTPGRLQQAIINVSGQLKKTVNLTPFALGDTTDPHFDPQFADDIIYGGLGSDFLHGASGDDAISGAEALAEYYAAPENSGDVLGFGATDRPNEFAAYDEFNPRRRILVDVNGEFLEPGDVDPNAREFLLNFDYLDGPLVGTDEQGHEVHSDGDDRIFGDLGNDWLVGGSGVDHVFGGYGDDLLNADDNHESTIGGADPRANDVPDTHATYEDIAYGGAGRDILIGNTGGDRLIDWAGEFNSYIVPFAPFGAAAISRSLQPQLFDYLYDLSESGGADPTRAADTGADPARNGEPEGEIGLVKQSDFDWQDQTGAPDDPQPGNIPGGPRDVLRSANFNNGAPQGFAADSGTWTVENGRLSVEPEFVGGDAVSVFYVDNVLPSYFEMQATINAAKRTGLYDSNAYVIFDYQGKDDFRFAGIDNMINKLVMGHRNAQGWFIDVQTPFLVKPDTDYNMLLSLHGVNATLLVDNEHVLTYAYQPRVVDGISFGLNTGMVGIGANNSIGRIDNVAVQILPPEITFEGTEEFPDTEPVIDIVEEAGIWTMSGGRYDGALLAGEDVAISLVDLGNTDPFRVSSLLEIEVVLDTEALGGVVFDLNAKRYKFAAIIPDADQVVIGHVTRSGAPVFDAVASFAIESGIDHQLTVSLKGTSVVVYVDGQALVGHFFNSVTADGRFGLYTMDGATSFDSIKIRTDDPSVLPAGGQPLAATLPAGESMAPSEGLEVSELEPVVERALQLWSEAQPERFDIARLETTTFEIVDLPGRLLGLTVGRAVKLDPAAAGHGWFAGRSTDDDRAAHIDLLTVVLHELGHVLGLAHDAGNGGLMAARLETGQRWLPVTLDRNEDASGSLPANAGEIEVGPDRTAPILSTTLRTTDRAPSSGGSSPDQGGELFEVTFDDRTSDLRSRPLIWYETGVEFDPAWSVSAGQWSISVDPWGWDSDDERALLPGTGVKRIFLPPRRPSR